MLVGVAAPWALENDDHDGHSAPTAPFLTDAERVTVAAVVGRLIPGGPGDPGAVDAGVVDYIDRKLGAGGFAEPTFVDGPYVEVVDDTPLADVDGALVVSRSQLYRYGYQSEAMPQTTYRQGIQALDRFAQDQFGAPFAQLVPADQDAVLTVLDDIQQASSGGSNDGQGTGSSSGSGGGGGGTSDAARQAFGEMSPGQFFSTVHTDTIEGMFADPAYGGNQGLVGWELIGYPGAQRSYSPSEMLHGTQRMPKSHDHMAPMNPDRPSDRGRGALEQPRNGVAEG